MLILLIGGLIVIIGLCIAIEGILAMLPVQHDEVIDHEPNHRAQVRAAFEATVKQEYQYLQQLQGRVARRQ